MATVKSMDSVTVYDYNDVTQVRTWYKTVSRTSSPPTVSPTATEAQVIANGWGTTEPTVDTTKKLYTVQECMFGDGSYVWGTVSLSSSYEAAIEAYNKAASAERAATETAQYFWFNGTDSGAGEGVGAHITEKEKDDFIDDPPNGGGNVLIDNNSVDVRNGTDVLATFGSNGIKMGTNDESRLDIDNNSLQFIDKENARIYYAEDFSTSSIYHRGDYVKHNSKYYQCTKTTVSAGPWNDDDWLEVFCTSYFYVGDLRGDTGQATITETFQKPNSALSYYFSFTPIVSVLKVVKNGITLEYDTDYILDNSAVTLRTSSDPYDTIEITYISSSSELKAYTFGSRSKDSMLGAYSVSEGIETEASGAYSHSEGGFTKAKGSWSHAEGFRTVASGECSHSEGGTTTASGFCSHSGGTNSYAKGPMSFAFGEGIVTDKRLSHVIGKLNLQNAIFAYYYCDFSSLEENPDSLTIYTRYIMDRYAITVFRNEVDITDSCSIYDNGIVVYNPEDGDEFLIYNSMDYPFVIGNGFKDNDITSSNGIAIDWSGNILMSLSPTRYYGIDTELTDAISAAGLTDKVLTKEYYKYNGESLTYNMMIDFKKYFTQLTNNIPFIAKQGVTTFSAISEAINDGKIVFAKDNNNCYYSYIWTESSNKHWFSRSQANPIVPRNAFLVCNSDNTWDTSGKTRTRVLGLGALYTIGTMSSGGTSLGFSIPTGRIFPSGTTISKITFSMIARAGSSNGAGKYIIKATSGGSGAQAFDSSTTTKFYNAADQQKSLTSAMWTTKAIEGQTNVRVFLDGDTSNVNNYFFVGNSTNNGYCNNQPIAIYLTGINITFVIPA